MKVKLLMVLACFFLSVGLALAQTSTVTGIVLSEEDGEPVIGASVLVQGTTIGTITDMDGKFVLSLPAAYLLRSLRARAISRSVSRRAMSSRLS